MAAAKKSTRSNPRNPFARCTTIDELRVAVRDTLAALEQQQNVTARHKKAAAAYFGEAMAERMEELGF